MDTAGEASLHQRRWRWSFFLLLWTLIGVLVVGSVVVQQTTDDVEIPWAEVWSSFFGWYVWGLLFALIWWLNQRLPFDRRHWPQWLLRNLGLGFVVSLLYVALTLMNDEILAGSFTGPSLGRAWELLLGGLQYYLLVYFAIVAVIHAISFYDKLRERELAASRLEGQLAQAKLQMLKMQLHPHFLFNTLNAVSALMHRDVDAADRMITRLSDFLRMSLEKDDRHQVRLESELEFLHRYLSIEKIRFRDRLKVDVEVEPECLAAQVPRLILQPLVENAVRHGIAMRSAAGQLAIQATKDGDRLRLVVADDGPGLPRSYELRPGVGLANTRSRLEEIYGEDFSFELKNADPSGFEAHIEIPFEREPRIGN